jgi:hypothetical protein
LRCQRFTRNLETYGCILKMLGELRHERDGLDEAITTLERLAIHGGKRRGRPPAWMAKARKGPQSAKRGRPFGSKNKPKVA